jgi:hypothetical protein
MQEKNWDIKIPSEFICEDNYYLIRGKKYARVTRINSIIDKPELRNWYMKTGSVKAKEILKTRSSFGSTAHKLIEITLKGEQLSENYDSFLIDTIKVFNKWRETHELIPQSLEQRLWSEKYKYAGTCDYVGSFDGKFMIGDWKTSKGIYPEYWLQLSAYVLAFEEQTGLKLDGAFILQIRDGEYSLETKTRDELIELFEIFKAAQTIYNWKYNYE